MFTKAEGQLNENDFYLNSELMDIMANAYYPASKLSNFAPNKFVFDGVLCNSMEGLLQSFKYKDHNMQVKICKLVGFAAKKKGYGKNWQKNQTLYWKGVSYDRKSKEYQNLLNRAYTALSHNTEFKKAIIDTGNATLKHSIGRTKESETILTKKEFCSRLTKIRKQLTYPTLFD